MTWKAKVVKEKAIFHTMNLFNYDVGRKCLIAEGWCPSGMIENVQFALRRATVSYFSLTFSHILQLSPLLLLFGKEVLLSLFLSLIF
jgi:vacuolar-type H+-ATPase subunit I/STV1